MNRRNFLAKTGCAIGVGSIMPFTGSSMSLKKYLNEWHDIRSQFNLTTHRIHMAQFLLASHPKSVRDAIRFYRNKFNEDPSEFWHIERRKRQNDVLQAAANYLQCQPTEIALTDSTTMGLGILYGGFKLKPGDDILTTTHDHYSTEKSLEFAAQRSGSKIRSINLYDDPFKANTDQICSRLKKSIKPNTRLVAVTYVHSSTGVKLPIKSMSEVIKDLNAHRSESDRIYLCVDAVHGFGVENITVESLGCDFLVAGTHKWLFGPRGTGIVWAKKDAWHMVESIIPPFSRAYLMWMGVMPKTELTFFEKITPGGFHSFEHRWALKEAFDFHVDIGKQKIESRTHFLNTILKKAMRDMPHIKLYTPLSNKLSSGITSFEVKGMKPDVVLKKLDKLNITSSTTPYKIIYNRLTPCILNTEEEVDLCIKAMENIKN